MFEHATVQQNPFILCNRVEAEFVEVAKRRYGKPLLVSYQPVENFPCNGNHWNAIVAPEKVTMTYEDANLPTHGKFYFDGIIFFTLPERSGNSILQVVLSNELLQHGIEERVEVSSSICHPDVGMITIDSVHAKSKFFYQRSYEIVKEELSASGDLLESNKLQLVWLLKINAFAIHDVAEKEKVNILAGKCGGNFLNLLCNSSEGGFCPFDTPSCSAPTVMKIRKKYNQSSAHRTQPT